MNYLHIEVGAKFESFRFSCLMLRALYVVLGLSPFKSLSSRGIKDVLMENAN